MNKSNKGEKIIQGKINRHDIIKNGKKYWISNNGQRREMPTMKELIIKTHLELNHRGMEGTYYNLKQRYYWIGLKKIY